MALTANLFRLVMPSDFPVKHPNHPAPRTVRLAQTILDAIPVEINPAQSEEKTWFWIAIGTSIFAGVTLLVTLLCISRIKIAVACVKVRTHATRQRQRHIQRRWP